MLLKKSHQTIKEFFFQAEDGIRDVAVTGVQTCALPISSRGAREDVGEQGRVGAQTAVPPTVMPSRRIVGNPTPTGTDWPSLPHVPTPSSSARSYPTRLTRVSASGPLPMSVAPFTGLVISPSSIR